MLDLDDILRQVGAGGAYRRVTLGKGAVGKVTSAYLGICGVLGIIAAGLLLVGNALYLFALAILACGLFVYFQRAILGFAKENPAAALLEGADFVKWHAAELAAKDLDVIPNTPLTGDPQNPIQSLAGPRNDE